MIHSGAKMEGMPRNAATRRPNTVAMPCVRRTPRTSRRPQYCATKMDAPLMAPNMATWKRKEMRLAWVTPASGTSPRTPIIRLSTSCIEAVTML